MHKLPQKLIYLSFLVMMTFIFSGCSTGFLRMPAAAPLNYNNEQVRLLTSMAQEGILFQFDDEFLKDIPNAQISETCNSAEITEWGDQFYSVLKIFYRDPEFFKKIHILQFKRGDKTSAEINRELDGTTYLVLTYQKVQKRENVTDEWRKKCNDFSPSREQVILTQMEWPTNQVIQKILADLPDKTEIPRFTFDRSFLVYLAQRKTIVRMTPSLTSEKIFPTMIPFLPQIMNQLAQQSRTTRFKYLDYYLQEIEQKSRLGSQFKFFSILQDQHLERGISLDGASRSIASSLVQQLTSTYLFISYRSTGGQYEHSSLQDLDQCLKIFNPVSSEISYRAERYLHPGFSCGQK